MAVPKGTRIGGRQKGTRNKSTADVKELARKYGPSAIARLAHLMDNAEAEAARVAACKEILDRAYGKATTVVANEAGEPFRVLQEIVLRGVRADTRD